MRCWIKTRAHHAVVAETAYCLQDTSNREIKRPTTPAFALGAILLCNTRDAGPEKVASDEPEWNILLRGAGRFNLGPLILN